MIILDYLERRFPVGRTVVLFLMMFVLSTWQQRINSLELKFFLHTNSSD